MAKSNFIVRGGANFNPLYKELNQAQKKLDGFKSGIGKTLKGAGALFGGIAVGKTIKDFTTTAMRTQTLNIAMNSVARSSGYATVAVNEHKKAVMDMGIAEQESTQILNRFMQAQLDTADASRLARVAQDAAVIANMNSSEAAEQMTEAIAKQRPVLLSQFGMTKNLNEIYKEYGARLGKTTAQLTTAEKKQAMLNYILQEGEKIAGTYEASMGAVGKQIGSLPRYWQTLQNVIATPLALPGLSVAVEALTNGLKNAIAWAEANEATLRRWGQNVTNIVSGVVNAFGWVTRTLANNWGMIKLVGTGLLSYAVATKTVAVTIGAWRTVNLLLNGTLVTQIPLLSTASKAVAIYRTQMALAPVATNIFTGALLKLRVGLYAVHAAIGPVGWAILALSAILAGGMIAWNKYNNSLEMPDIDQALADSMQEIDDVMQGLEDSSLDAGEGQEGLADGIGKASKAAKKALAPFDELNILQQNMDSGGGGGIPSGLNLGNPFEGLNFTPPTIDTINFDGVIDESKKKLDGFFMWVGDKWDGLKQTFAIPITVPAPVFASIPMPIYQPNWGLTPPLVPAPVFNPILNPVYKPNWGLDVPKVAKPVFSPIPNRIYEPNWGLGLPKIPIPVFPAIEYGKYNNSLEAIRAASVQTSSALEKENSRVTKKITDALNTAWGSIESSYNKHKGTFGSITTGISKAWETENNNIRNKVTQRLQTTWGTIETNYNKHKGSVGTIATGISTVLVANINKGLSTIGTNINNTITTTQNNLQTWGKNIGGIAIESAKGLTSNIAEGLKVTAQNTVSFANGHLSNMRSWGSGVLAVAGETARGFASNMASGFSSTWDSFKSLMSGMGERVSGWFSENKSMVIKTTIVAGAVVGAGALAMAMPAAIPYIASALGGLASIPALAKGGITNGEMIAIIGDNPGGKEVVSPLDGLLDMIKVAVSDNGNNSSGDTTIVVKIGEDTITEKVVSNINRQSRISGKTIITV